MLHKPTQQDIHPSKLGTYFMASFLTPKTLRTTPRLSPYGPLAWVTNWDRIKMSSFVTSIFLYAGRPKTGGSVWKCVKIQGATFGAWATNPTAKSETRAPSLQSASSFRTSASVERFFGEEVKVLACGNSAMVGVVGAFIARHCIEGPQGQKGHAVQRVTLQTSTGVWGCCLASTAESCCLTMRVLSVMPGPVCHRTSSAKQNSWEAFRPHELLQPELRGNTLETRQAARS